MAGRQPGVLEGGQVGGALVVLGAHLAEPPGLAHHPAQRDQVLVDIGGRPSLLGEDRADAHRVLVAQQVPGLPGAGGAGVAGDDAGDPVEAAAHRAPRLGGGQGVEVDHVGVGGGRDGAQAGVGYGGHVHGAILGRSSPGRC